MRAQKTESCKMTYQQSFRSIYSLWMVHSTFWMMHNYRITATRQQITKCAFKDGNNTITVMKFVKAILIIWICCEIQEVVLKTATRKGSINDIVFPFEIRSNIHDERRKYIQTHVFIDSTINARRILIIYYMKMFWIY